MNFKTWLRGQESRPDAVGDLARDNNGGCCPLESVEILKAHILDRHADYVDGVMETVDRAWREYQG